MVEFSISMKFIIMNNAFTIIKKQHFFRSPRWLGTPRCSKALNVWQQIGTIKKDINEVSPATDFYIHRKSTVFVMPTLSYIGLRGYNGKLRCHQWLASWRRSDFSVPKNGQNWSGGLTDHLGWMTTIKPGGVSAHLASSPNEFQNAREFADVVQRRMICSALGVWN